ncbi:MAG TPA: hypothetical protein VFK44_06120 [Bacillales bacterium]|nr:hypothetical protein [Bacillales bacterium]
MVKKVLLSLALLIGLAVSAFSLNPVIESELSKSNMFEKSVDHEFGLILINIMQKSVDDEFGLILFQDVAKSVMTKSVDHEFGLILIGK